MTEWRVRSITRALLPILLALTLVEIVSGLVLDSFAETLLDHRSLLVLVPVMIGTAGNLGSVLAARTSTAFHLGTLSFSPRDETLVGGALSAVALAVTVFPLVGAGGWLLARVLGGVDLGLSTVIAIALVSGVALAFVAIIVTLVATYVTYRFGLDPDDVVIPVVTNVCDVLGVLVFFVVVHLLV